MFGNMRYGYELIDFYDENLSSRMGQRIKKIREDKGLSRQELGERIGLSSDRIQKYENGIRKPKTEMIKKIAEALGVSPLTIVDPATVNYVGAMYAFFEIAAIFDITIEERDDDKVPGINLVADFRNELYPYLKEWCDLYMSTKSKLLESSSEEERKNIISEYNDWVWNFPKGYIDKIQQHVKESQMKRQMKKRQKEDNEMPDDE